MRIWAGEVGCRGFPAASMATFIKDIGVTGAERKRKLRKVGKTTERASKWLWNSNRLKEWGKFSG